MTKLRIAPDLTLPLDAVTQAIGIVAKRRVGKSYTARRFAEQLLVAGQQVVIVDPKGDWWGIRSAADGKSPGLAVVILGGEHGDIPLEVNGGEIVAKLVAEERVSVLLDLSQFRKREVARFMTDFLESLYRLKAKESLRTPLMLIIDEADAIAPQKPQEGEERMLGAAEDIVRRGGQRGIGCMMITQRTAVLNKNVLTQCEMLVALRTIAPQDLKAMQAWIDVHGSIEERDTLMESLPALPQGDAWFWSPGWPTADGIFKRVHVLPIETFDSGATPKSGERRIEPKNLADVDLGALTKQMAATIEKAKADDPKELRKQLASVRAELTKAQKAVQPKGEKIIVDQSAIDRAVDAARARWASDFKSLVGADVEKMRRAVDRLASSTILADVITAFAALDKTLAPSEVAPVPPVPASSNGKHPAAAPIARTIPRRAVAQAMASVDGVTGVEQRILNTLAGLEALGVDQPDKATVAALVGYHPNAKSYANAIGSLRTSGRIEYPIGGRISLTTDGRAIAENSLPVSSTAELHELWFDRLGNVARKILEPVLAAHPAAVAVADVAESAGYHPNAKSFSNMKGRLRTLGLIDYPSSGNMVATDVLFPAGLS